MSIFGGFFHKSGHENPENIDNNHHVPVDDHVPTDDELLGEDEEIMRTAYLTKQKNYEANHDGNEVLDDDVKV